MAKIRPRHNLTRTHGFNLNGHDSMHRNGNLPLIPTVGYQSNAPSHLLPFPAEPRGVAIPPRRPITGERANWHSNSLKANPRVPTQSQWNSECTRSVSTVNRSAAIPGHGRARARRLLQLRRGIPEILGRLRVQGHRATTQGGLRKVQRQQWGLNGGAHTHRWRLSHPSLAATSSLPLYSVVSPVAARVVEEEARLEGGIIYHGRARPTAGLRAPADPHQVAPHLRGGWRT
jgi:hypothetical protein